MTTRFVVRIYDLATNRLMFTRIQEMTLSAELLGVPVRVECEEYVSAVLPSTHHPIINMAEQAIAKAIESAVITEETIHDATGQVAQCEASALGA